MRKFTGPLHLPGLMQNMNKKIGDKKGLKTVTKRDPNNKVMNSTIDLLYNKRKRLWHRKHNFGNTKFQSAFA